MHHNQKIQDWHYVVNVDRCLHDDPARSDLSLPLLVSAPLVISVPRLATFSAFHKQDTMLVFADSVWQQTIRTVG